MNDNMSDVRVRFAPSPTGYLHVGGLRTALYNYLFARRHGGTFVLRIEDTDQSRRVEDALETLLDALDWVGLEYDEGPVLPSGVKGGAGPYIQSQRLEIYRKYADQLVENGNAYHCFCSEERLEKVRQQQQELGQRTKYDKHCRRLSPQERNNRLEAGMPSVIRMKIPEDDAELTFTDAIREEVTIPYENLDDQVLVKSDGFPTYHLANVVDDHLMDISHVIRGEEWLPSTPKHILLYTYFGWEVPTFAHLPLLLNEDRSKLSKRQGDVAVSDYRDKGFMPDALLNFVALLGWSPGDDEEILDRTEMIRRFSLGRINKSGAVFDVEKLEWMNGVYIRNTPTEELLEPSLPFLAEAGFDTSDRETMLKILEAVKKKLRTLADIPEKTRAFQGGPVQMNPEEAEEINELIGQETSKTVFASLAEKFESVEKVEEDTFQRLMKEVQQETGVGGKNLWMPVRIALTGEMHGPDLTAVVEILGKDRCVRRFREQLNGEG